MPEFDVMARYPKTDRSNLLTVRSTVSDEDRLTAQRFSWEYFDGPRHLGMGGYRYSPRFFTPVAEDMISRYNLTSESRVLDVGCGKGFLLFELEYLVPGITVRGIDISDYCLENLMPGLDGKCYKASCDALPFLDSDFDLVISIATIHNLHLPKVIKSVQEIVRVGKGQGFIKVNGYKTYDELVRLEEWNLVAKTILPTWAWEEMFAREGYTGDYSFFTP